MTALELTDLKTITAHLFLRNTFDAFCLIEGEITTFNTFHIDGRIHPEFFDTGEAAGGYSCWGQLRDYCLSLIRGKRTPLGFRFIFSLSPEETARLMEQNGSSTSPDAIGGLYLNFHFDGTALTCVTGTSFKTFIPDKSTEHLWDEAAQAFLRQHQIPFEIK